MTVQNHAKHDGLLAARAAERAKQLHEPFFEVQVDHVVERSPDSLEIRGHARLPVAHHPRLGPAVRVLAGEEHERRTGGRGGRAPATRSRLIPFLKRSIGTSVTSRPLSMTPIQSQKRSSSWTRWLEMKTVACRCET